MFVLDGWTCHLDPEIAMNLDLEEPYHRVGARCSKTTPRVGLQYHDKEHKKAYYKKKWYALVAEMYNLIFNHCARVKTNVLQRLLRNCHQFVVIFPTKRNNLGHGMMYSLITRQKIQKKKDRRTLLASIIDHEYGLLMDPQYIQVES